MQNPYANLFAICMLVGATIGYVYWRTVILNKRELDNWSSNVLAIMLFSASVISLIVLMLSYNPFMPFRIQYNSPYIISKEQYTKQIQNKKTKILDLRNLALYEDFHLEGAIHLDFYEKNFQKKIDNLQKNTVYLLYCPALILCKRTAKILARQGFHYVYYAEDYPYVNKKKNKK